MYKLPLIPAHRDEDAEFTHYLPMIDTRGKSLAEVLLIPKFEHAFELWQLLADINASFERQAQAFLMRHPNEAEERELRESYPVSFWIGPDVLHFSQTVALIDPRIRPEPHILDAELYCKLTFEIYPMYIHEGESEPRRIDA